jgi:seryl-tRNA synthetase
VKKAMSCEDVQKLVIIHSKGAFNRAGRIESRVDQIAKLVEDFYQTLDKKDQNVSNYQSLVSDIASKSAQIQKSQDKLEADSAGLKCDSSPKAQVVKIRDDVKTLASDLKDYKASIRKLILAINPSAADEIKEGAKTSEKGNANE